MTGQFFQQRKSLLATDSLGDSGENSKYTTDDNAEGIYKGGLSSRLRSPGAACSRSPSTPGSWRPARRRP